MTYTLSFTEQIAFYPWVVNAKNRNAYEGMKYLRKQSKHLFDFWV